MKIVTCTFVILSLCLQISLFAAQHWNEATAWPAEVPGHVPPEPGEHPRLFFRKADLPKIKERAAKPEGQAIVARLRFLLNRGDGKTMPEHKRPMDAAYGDQSKPINLPEGAYSMSHAAGYGFLYQLTGEQIYADLGRKCFEWAFEGVRDRDAKGRYSWKKPTGALRAGPALGWYAVGYDLCYDGWDEEFRQKVALELQNYNEGQWEEIGKLARGARLGFTSNHAGPQIGGAALALLAIMGDPGVDKTKVDELLKVSAESVLGQLQKGWGPSGWYSQGDGAGSISSDNALIPAMQAWRVAGGKDFITPRPNAQMMTLKFLYGTVSVNGRATFPSRGMYPHNVWARNNGMSGCGTFSQGFAAIDDKFKPALLWLYQQHFKQGDEKAKAPFDTPSPYPHRAILALINWPFGMEPKNPGEILPLNSADLTGKPGYFFLRNQWKDESDLMVSLFGYNAYQTKILGMGLNLEFTMLPGSTFNHYRSFKDGSALVSNAKGETYMVVDFSRASGAELVYIVLGKGATGGKDQQGKGGSVKVHQLKVGDRPVVVATFQSGDAPEVKLEGDAILVAGKSYRFDGEKFIVPHISTAE